MFVPNDACQFRQYILAQVRTLYLRTRERAADVNCARSGRVVDDLSRHPGFAKIMRLGALVKYHSAGRFTVRVVVVVLRACRRPLCNVGAIADRAVCHGRLLHVCTPHLRRTFFWTGRYRSLRRARDVSIVLNCRSENDILCTCMPIGGPAVTFVTNTRTR